MMRFSKIIVALLCIACVLALCIAPYVDIPVTVLKSLQIAVLLLLSLAGAALLLANIFHWVLVRYSVVRADCRTPVRALFLPIKTNCVQQC
jgi:hypothetical protein